MTETAKSQNYIPLKLRQY